MLKGSSNCPTNSLYSAQGLYGSDMACNSAARNGETAHSTETLDPPLGFAESRDLFPLGDVVPVVYATSSTTSW